MILINNFLLYLFSIIFHKYLLINENNFKREQLKEDIILILKKNYPDLIFQNDRFRKRYKNEDSKN